MAAKRRSLLSAAVPRHLEDALLEALQRHLGGSRKKKNVSVRKKNAGKKRPARRRKRRA